MNSRRRKVVKANYTRTLGLQEDVLVEILSKMPVKSLLRCRCVSQEWYALTKSSYFISRHLVHQSCCSDRHHPCFIFLSYLAGTSESNFQPLGVSLLRNEETTVLRLPFFSNLTSQRRGLRLVGSSNGLVCCVLLIGIENDKNRTTEGEEDNALLYQQLIVVWNPATEQFRFLPKPNNIIALNQDEEEDIVRLMDNSLSCYSLIGFDFVNDHDITEYKLVRVFNHDSDDPNGPGEVVTTFQAQVFVQSTNSWRLAENELRFASCVNSFASTSVTLNGVLYWKAQGAGNECCVLSFNLREEVFNVMQLPMDLQNQEDWGECPLYSWRNSLATVVLDFSNTDDVNAMLWVMSTDDQVSLKSCESGAQMQNPAWSPQFRFKNSVIEDMTRLLGSWKDQFLYASERSDEVVNTAADNIVPQDLFTYDPKCEIKRKILKDGERIKFCYGVNYVESLVPV